MRLNWITGTQLVCFGVCLGFIIGVWPDTSRLWAPALALFFNALIFSITSREGN